MVFYERLPYRGCKVKYHTQGKSEVGMAAAPLPKKQVDLDAKIDEVIAKIDEALPRIHQRVAQGEEGLTPSPGHGNFMRTQQALSQLAREIQESAEIDAVELEVKMIERRRLAPPKSASV